MKFLKNIQNLFRTHKKDYRILFSFVWVGPLADRPGSRLGIIALKEILLDGVVSRTEIFSVPAYDLIPDWGQKQNCDPETMERNALKELCRWAIRMGLPENTSISLGGVERQNIGFQNFAWRTPFFYTLPNLTNSRPEIASVCTIAEAQADPSPIFKNMPFLKLELVH